MDKSKVKISQNLLPVFSEYMNFTSGMYVKLELKKQLRLQKYFGSKVHMVSLQGETTTTYV